MDIYSFFQFLLVIACEGGESTLTWEVDKPVVRYGEDLSLFCPVENCCSDSAGWIKWISEKEFSTLFIDVKDLTVDESSKYDGGTNERGFFLDIRNINRQDLNIEYSCTYGFQVSEKRLLLDSDIFFPKTNIGQESDSRTDKKSEKTDVILPLLVIVGGCIVVVLTVILVIITLRFKKERKIKEQTLIDFGEYLFHKKEAIKDKKKVEGEVPIVDKSETADKNKVEEEVPLLETSKTADKKKVEGEVPLVETSETADEHPQPVSYKQTNHNKNTNNGKYEVKVQINESRTTVEQQQPASSNQTSHEKTIYSVNNEEEEVPINKSKTTVKQLQPVSSNHTTTANDNTKEL